MAQIGANQSNVNTQRTAGGAVANYAATAGRDQSNAPHYGHERHQPSYSSNVVGSHTYGS